jgi:hypothetical protein
VGNETPPPAKSDVASWSKRNTNVSEVSNFHVISVHWIIGTYNLTKCKKSFESRVGILVLRICHHASKKQKPHVVENFKELSSAKND